MNLEQFKKIIIPLALKIGYMPEIHPQEKGDAFVSDLFNSCINPKHFWEAQSYMFDNWGTLNLDFKYLVESVIALIKNYKNIIELDSQGKKRAKIICYKALPDCPNNQYVLIKDLLDGFNSAGELGIVVPRLDCPKNFQDGGDLCSGRILEVLELPTDLAWMQEILDPDSKNP